MSVRSKLIALKRKADEEAGELNVGVEWPPEGMIEGAWLCSMAVGAAYTSPRLGEMEVDFTFSWEHHYEAIRPGGVMSPLFELKHFDASRLKGLARDVFKVLRHEFFGLDPEVVDSSNKHVNSFRIKFRWGSAS